jgi:glycosyltransferase involved in cell wall biosynthesis
MRDDLFVGVTTWNSERFLEHCLRAVKATTDGMRMRLGVVDNESTDRSLQVARDMGADVRIERCSQSIALNRLLSMSSARHTLLLHSDVILVSTRWYQTCSGRMVGNVALVSPEDIGCGPLTRPYGAGMPESCFMLFDTDKVRRARTWTWIRRRGVPWPRLRLDLDHYYVTHDLPDTLRRRGYDWVPMSVHTSPEDPSFVFTPSFIPEYWSDELGRLRYAMGNFYSLDGEVTHYHNWFDRVPKDVPLASTETTEGGGKGLPLAYLSLGTRRFLDDLSAGRLVLPSAREAERVPVQTPRQEPDLTRSWDSRISSGATASLS